MATTSADILTLLENDHQQVKHQFTELDLAGPSAREELFCELVQMLVSHEVAEEMVVYPAIRSDAPGGEREADERIEEQAKAERQLSAMEKVDPTSDEFSLQLFSLKTAVLKHAEAEEQEVFPLLLEVEDMGTRREMAVRYLRAKDSAPTHPHPHSPDRPPGNRLLGPVTALFDKARDAAQRS